MSNQIKYNGTTYEGNQIRSGSLYLSEALASAELEADVMNVVVKDESTQPKLLAANGMLVSAGSMLLATKGAEHGIDHYAQYGQRVDLFHDGTLVAPLYLTDIIRVARYEYQLNCISGVGLLLTSDHYGGIYSGETCGTLIADIIGGIVPYTIDAALASTPMYGWLPIAPRRDNLRDVLFAVGGQIRKDTTGKITIIPQTSPTPYPVSGDELYLGGSVTGGNPATGVMLTEHTYIARDEDERTTLFDGEAAAESMTTPMGKSVVGLLVTFDAPFHNLTVENSELLESGANYAVISGSPAALLTGKRYTHVLRTISRRGAETRTPNIITSEKCGLINLFNAELVADRLMAYYSAARTVETDMILTDQKPGDAVTFTDPFGEQAEGYIGSMDINISNTLMAHTTIISGFIPTASGNYYSHLAVLTGSGSWTVPAEYKGKIRVVLIGGGQGGQGGTGGNGVTYQLALSDSPLPDNNGAGAAGGSPGTPGHGGKVFVQTLTVSVGQTINYKAGKGGVGGLGGAGGVAVGYDPIYITDKTPAIGSVGELGHEGEDTYFDNLTSANGKMMEAGYVEIQGNLLYATHGPEGVPGGAGGGVYGGAKPGESVEKWPGGAPGGSSYAFGGGGGAAYGAAGNDGGPPRIENNVSIVGAGGKGASAIQAAQGATYGAGGQGGHGGGGGGAPGASLSNYRQPAGSASGGAGGQGGNGAPGVILIYY